MGQSFTQLHLNFPTQNKEEHNIDLWLNIDGIALFTTWYNHARMSMTRHNIDAQTLTHWKYKLGGFMNID